MTKSLLLNDHTTCVRGMSVLLIAIFHVLLEWGDMPRYINLTGSVCVAAFLFLSGYGIHESYKKKGLNGYWLKRFKRIILPYTLFITVLIPFNPDFELKNYLLDIAYIRSSYWFIEFVVWNYLVYWIAQRFFSKHIYVVFLLFGLFSLNMLMQIEAEQSFSFVAGIFVSEHIGKIRQTARRQINKVVVFFFLLGFFFLALKEIPFIHSFKGTLPYNYILLMIKLPLAIPLIFLPVYIPFLLRSRLLYISGISSLEIYLVHMALIKCIDASYLWLALYLLFTVVLTYLFYQVNKLILRYVG